MRGFQSIKLKMMIHGNLSLVDLNLVKVSSFSASFNEHCQLATVSRCLVIVAFSVFGREIFLSKSAPQSPWRASPSLRGWESHTRKGLRDFFF